MRRIEKIGITFGFIFLSFAFCFLSLTTGLLEAEAGVLDYDFTYTSDDTAKMGNLGDTIRFDMTLTNTGDSADSYEVSLAENSPTPTQWWIWFCSDGVCHDTSVTKDTVYLGVDEEDPQFLEIAARRICGSASVTMTVTSFGNTNLSKSITFLLDVYTPGEACPVTDRWGLFILISLLFVAGLYLIWKRLRPVRAT